MPRRGPQHPHQQQKRKPDLEYSKGLRRPVGKVGERWVWEDDPEEPQPLRHNIFSYCTIPISQGTQHPRCCRGQWDFVFWDVNAQGDRSAAKLMLCCLCSLIALLCWLKNYLRENV